MTKNIVKRSRNSATKSQNIFIRIFKSRKHEYRKTKIVVGFLYGLLLGLGFYEMILIDLNFYEQVAFVVGGIISLMLAFGIAFSSQIRCIAFLAIPVFAGHGGRGVIKALILSFLISGPIENLTRNGKEVVRVFACSTSLTFNLTKTRFELMFKPFTEALFGMKTDVNEVKDTLRSVRDVSAPITSELEDETEMKKLKEENDYVDDKLGDTRRSDAIDNKYLTKGEQVEAERYEKKYLEKVELRCNQQFSTAAMKCRAMFQTAYDKCYDTVTWFAAWLLCWPMKLDFVCNIAQALGGESRCDPSNEMDPGFGEGYGYLKRSKVALSENFKNVKLQYSFFKLRQLIDLQDATDTATAILHEVDSRKEIMDKIFLILKRILAFVFLWIIVASQRYHDKFLRDIEFDNVYITKYFKKIDARRKVAEKMVLFPLKKFERMKIIDYWSKNYLKSEQKHIFSECLRLVIEIIFVTTFILLDRLFYEALDLVRRHAKIEYTQVGRHDMLLEVKGTGMIASLLRSVVRGFNIKKRVKIVRSNEQCLPRVTLMSKMYSFKIYGLFLLIIIFMLLESYTQRLRPMICGYFYRKRQKKRILYLYNETLRRRVGFLKYMKKHITKLVREQRLEETTNVCIILRTKYPKAMDILKVFGMARKKCVICEEPERIFGTANDFEICKNVGCHLIYCKECWIDIEQECIACKEIDSDTSGYEDETEHDDID